MPTDEPKEENKTSLEEEKSHETSLEEKNETSFAPHLWRQRRSFAFHRIQSSDIKTVMDLGCGEGALLEILLNDTKFSFLAGVDVDSQVLAVCKKNCTPTDMDYNYLRELPITLHLYKGSLSKFDDRLIGYDAITLLEVVEHLEQPELQALPEIVFGKYQPKLCIVSTPNSEFNINFPNLNYGTEQQSFRHWDHKFEWTRGEFEGWCLKICETYGYKMEISGVGILPKSIFNVGFCSQICVFTRISDTVNSIPNQRNYQLRSTIDFPYFVEDGFTDAQIVQCMEDETIALVTDWKTVGVNPIFSFDDYWGILRVKQLCKHKHRMVEAVTSTEADQIFKVDLNNEKLMVLFGLIPPVVLNWEPGPEYLESVSNSGSELEAMEVECPEWDQKVGFPEDTNWDTPIDSDQVVAFASGWETVPEAEAIITDQIDQMNLQ
jgi:hypothetical protein